MFKRQHNSLRTFLRFSHVRGADSLFYTVTRSFFHGNPFRFIGAVCEFVRKLLFSRSIFVLPFDRKNNKASRGRGCARQHRWNGDISVQKSIAFFYESTRDRVRYSRYSASAIGLLQLRTFLWCRDLRFCGKQLRRRSKSSRENFQLSWQLHQFNATFIIPKTETQNL